MRRTLSYVLLVFLHSCFGFSGFPGRINRQGFPNDMSMHQKIIELNRIKTIIEKTLGMYGMSTESPKQTKKPIQEIPTTTSVYKLPQVTEYYSEPPENSTDENILQFRLDADSPGKRVEVKNVRLFIRIKMNKNKDERKRTKPKREILSKEERQSRKRKRKNQLKEITLRVCKVKEDGSPGKEVTTVTAKIRKTKFLRLTLPKQEIQEALDSNNKTIQFFVKCQGCDKKARMITTSKRRKRTRRKNGGTIKPKLMKRRPFMILQSHIVSGADIR